MKGDLKLLKLSELANDQTRFEACLKTVIKSLDSDYGDDNLDAVLLALVDYSCTLDGVEYYELGVMYSHLYEALHWWRVYNESD
jgi:hypothetical protein